MKIQKNLNKTSYKLLSLTALAIAIVLTLFLNSQSTQTEAKQGDFNRNYLENTSIPQEAFAYNGLGGIKYHRGKLFIRDFEERKIVAFDIGGKILNNYFEEIPDETASIIISWDVDEEGIYTADARRHTISHISFDNELIYRYKPGIKIGRAAKLKEDHFVINTPDTTQDYKLSIVKAAIKKDSITNLNYPLDDIEYSILKYSGFYVRNNSGQTFYVCFKSGLFFCINNDGKFQYLAQTIDKSTIADVVQQGPKLTFDPLSPLVNKSACVDNEYLYILSNIVASSENLLNFSVIDAYKIESGEYAWSLKVENYKNEKISKMTVTPDRFYLSQGKFITYLEKPKTDYL